MNQIDLTKFHDFRYYASNLLKIKTETRQIIPFIFNIEQERLHKIWEWQLKIIGMVRLIILKDRRIGVSTYVDSRQFHQTATIPNTGGFIATHDKPSLGKIFGMAKLFYDELPSDFRPMKRYCVDLKTRCLTKTGWASYNQLTTGMEVYALNQNTGKGEWTKIKSLFVGNYQGKIHKWCGSDFSAVSTPDHRWLVTSNKRRYRDPGISSPGQNGGHEISLRYSIVQTKDIKPYTDIIPTGAPTSQEEAPILDDMLKLLAWIVTEGTFFRKYDIKISQSLKTNPLYAAEITQLIESLQLPYWFSVSATGLALWGFNGNTGAILRKMLPEKRFDWKLLTTLSSRQAEILLAELIKGDGAIKKAKTGFYYSADPLLTDQICALTCFSGRSFYSRIVNKQKLNQKRKIEKYKDVKLTSIHDIPVTWVSSLQRTEEEFDDLVWCPETELGTWLAEREGTCYFTMNSNKTELVFENPNEKERFTNPGLRSFMEVFSANTGTASRAGGYTFGHFSEVAFYNNAETLITSTVPSIQDNPGTVKVYESTGNGRQGFFYEQWKKAKKSLKSPRKLSNFYPVFFGWLTFPEYIKSFRSKQERVDLLGTLDDEELYLIQKYKATPEQLNWRRSKILDFDDDVEKFHQEFPSDDEEAFIAKGIPYFSKRLLLKMKNQCQPPLKVGDIGEFGFVENENGNLSIWEFPKEGYDYVISADVGEGDEFNDASVIQVLRAPKGSPLIKQVAEWRGFIDPTMFAGKIAALGNMYNEGLAVPECKHPGLTTLAELKHIYWNIYQWEYIDRFKNAKSTKLGWETNVSTKPIACSYLATCITAGILEINSEDLIDEMLVFVRNTNNSGEADYNCHDDLVMAFMIGVFCLGNAYNVGSLLQKLGQFKEKETPPKEQKWRDPAKHDLEFFREREEMVGADDRSWLNY